MELNATVTEHWLDVDLLSGPGVAAIPCRFFAHAEGEGR